MCCAQSLHHVRLSVTPWTAVHQPSLSMGFSRQEYWSGLPFPSPGDLPDTGIKPASLLSPALTGKFFITSATWEALHPSQEHTSNDRKQQLLRAMTTNVYLSQAFQAEHIKLRAGSTAGSNAMGVTLLLCTIQCNHICSINTSSRCRWVRRYGAMVFVNTDPCFHQEKSDENLFYFYMFIYLAALGLSCSMQEL